jgi:NADH dehydrogenase/NADH:ubiquinone oxidoreductase subunit G
VAGFNDLGTSGRGRATEIGTYVEKMLSSEMSGNLADVCPVGALNHGPTAYNMRPYELLSKNTIDLMDSLGSNVQLDHKENTIMRVLPRVNESINEEWLSDKSRQAFDGLKRQRLLAPMLRKGETFYEEEWEDVLNIIAHRVHNVDGSEIACGIGEFESLECLLALKDYLNALNCFSYEFRSHNNYKIPSNFRTDYLFNTQIEQLEDADLLLLVGVNPRTEAPVLNSRILKTTRKRNIEVISIGSSTDLTYPYEHLGSNPAILREIEAGTHPICSKIQAAKLPLMIVGRDALTRNDGDAILNSTKKIANAQGFVNAESGWNGYNILNRSQGEINAL